MNWIAKISIPLLSVALIGARHEGPSYDTKPRYALDAFATKLAKNYQLEFLNSGLGQLAGAPDGLWALSLVSHKQLTLEEGQELARAIARQLLRKVFEDPLFADYCEKAGSPARGYKLKKEYVAFRLAFWDQNNNRPLYPYLAQVRFVDGKLYYHYADSATQSLQEPIIEPLDP